MKARLQTPAKAEPRNTKRLPMAGRVTNGVKALTQKGKEYPKAIEYWTLSGKNEYLSRFEATLGKPSTLRIVFYSEDDHVNCRIAYELRNHSGATFAKGDGTTFKVWDETQPGGGGMAKVEIDIEMQSEWMEAQLDRCKKMSNKPNFNPEWKTRLDLEFMIPDMSSIWCSWGYTTTSKIAAENLIGVYDMVKSQAGRIAGIPFDLTTVMHKADNPGKKSYPVVSLTPVLDQSRIDAIREHANLFNSPILKQLNAEEVDQTIQHASLMIESGGHDDSIQEVHDTSELSLDDMRAYQESVIAELRKCMTKDEVNQIRNKATRLHGNDKFEKFVEGVLEMLEEVPV